MGFDDMFEHQSNHRRYSHYAEQAHDDNKRHNHGSHNGSVMSYYLNYFLSKIKNNRRLKIGIGIFGVILLAILIALVIIIIPLIAKLIDFIGQNGIHGVVDNISGFLDKIWKGAGK